jgi:tRNA modification GTPase
LDICANACESIITRADRAALAEVRALAGAADGRLPVIVVRNKADLEQRLDESVVVAALGPARVAAVSALTGQGMPALEAAIEAAALGGDARAQRDPALMTARQEASLYAALEHVRAALSALAAGLPPDLVAIDVRAALDHVGEITGEAVGEALLDEIFSRFCIGK